MINYSVIIPNFNGAKFLDECLDSLYIAIKNCSDSKFEIILVDNGSKDDSLKIFKNKIEKIKIPYNFICLDKNTGFANAVNLGVKKAQYDWVVLCNNDLTLDKNWFKYISESIKKNKDPKVVTYFGTVLTKDGAKYESQGLEYFIQGKAKNINNGQPFALSEINHQQPNFVWGASAALVVYSKKILLDIGGFDPDFFAYEEDVDLAYRLNALKFKTLCIPQSISYHLGGGTSNQIVNLRYRMSIKNWFFILIKNCPTKQILKNILPIIEERLRNLSGFIKSTIKEYEIKAIYRIPLGLIKTYGEVIIKLPRMITRRKQIQKLIESTKL